MQLYHGSLNHHVFEESVFFSTCKNFAEDYGDVHLYEVGLNNLFNTLNEAHIKQLLNRIHCLYEPYDEIEIHTYEEYIASPFYGCDNWEMFEQYLKSIKQMGFQSVKIFEGGIENYIILDGAYQLIL